MCVPRGRLAAIIAIGPAAIELVPPALWGCREHWYALPQYLRNKIWICYKPGQEDTRSPSRKYVEVAREVQAWIASHTGER